MKSESVVIADQQAAVNTFSGLVHTARQANKVGGGRRAPQGELSRIQRWGLSRNKVSLAEAGDGSPPFYFIIGIIEKLPISPQGRMKEFQDKADSCAQERGVYKQSWLILLFCVHHRSHDSLKVVFLSPFGRQNKISPRGDFLMVSLRSRSDRESLLTINPPK